LKFGRRRTLLVLLVFACLLGFAGSACADSPEPESATDVQKAEEGGHAAGHEALYKWINFILLAGGLAFVLRKPLSEFFVQRSASIRKSLEEGRKALETSQAQMQAVEEKLRHFEEAMATFRAAALREMAEEHEHIRQTAAREAEKMMESVRAQMDVGSKQARLELKLFAAQMAVGLAEEMIVQRLDEAGQKRLVNQFMAQLKTKRTPN
jgi:F-type H+-transporting ATPase subunit b